MFVAKKVNGNVFSRWTIKALALTVQCAGVLLPFTILACLGANLLKQSQFLLFVYGSFILNLSIEIVKVPRAKEGRLREILANVSQNYQGAFITAFQQVLMGSGVIVGAQYLIQGTSPLVFFWTENLTYLPVSNGLVGLDISNWFGPAAYAGSAAISGSILGIRSFMFHYTSMSILRMNWGSAKKLSSAAEQLNKENVLFLQLGGMVVAAVVFCLAPVLTPLMLAFFSCAMMVVLNDVVQEGELQTTRVYAEAANALVNKNRNGS